MTVIQRLWKRLKQIVCRHYMVIRHYDAVDCVAAYVVFCRKCDQSKWVFNSSFTKWKVK